MMKECFKECSEDQDVKFIYERGSENAVVRKQDISENEQDEILKSLDSNQNSKKVRLMSYVNHKSQELRKEYHRIFDSMCDKCCENN